MRRRIGWVRVLVALTLPIMVGLGVRVSGAVAQGSGTTLHCQSGPTPVQGSEAWADAVMQYGGGDVPPRCMPVARGPIDTVDPSLDRWWAWPRPGGRVVFLRVTVEGRTSAQDQLQEKLVVRALAPGQSRSAQVFETAAFDLGDAEPDINWQMYENADGELVFQWTGSEFQNVHIDSTRFWAVNERGGTVTAVRRWADTPNIAACADYDPNDRSHGRDPAYNLEARRCENGLLAARPIWTHSRHRECGATIVSEDGTALLKSRPGGRGQRVAELDEGTRVTIGREKGDWVELTAPTRGWTHTRLVQRWCIERP